MLDRMDKQFCFYFCWQWQTLDTMCSDLAPDMKHHSQQNVNRSHTPLFQLSLTIWFALLFPVIPSPANPSVLLITRLKGLWCVYNEFPSPGFSGGQDALLKCFAQRFSKQVFIVACYHVCLYRVSYNLFLKYLVHVIFPRLNDVLCCFIVFPPVQGSRSGFSQVCRGEREKQWFVLVIRWMYQDITYIKTRAWYICI